MKRFLHFLASFLSAVLLVCILFTMPASAEETQDMSRSQGLQYYVSDAAGILSREKWENLEHEAERVSQQYGCGVYIVTVQDYRDYISGSVRNCAEAFYSQYGLGLGENRDGSLLFLSMADRDYSLIAYGPGAHYAFTDYASGWLAEGFLDNFRQNDWYGGFSDYIKGCEQLLSRAASGNPLDQPQSNRSGVDHGMGALITALVSSLTALGVCQGMKRKMKPVRQKTSAEDYVVRGGIDLRLKRDVFLNRTVTRTVIRTDDRNTGSHSGGHFGGTTVNSGGFSGHSGKF